MPDDGDAAAPVDAAEPLVPPAGDEPVDGADGVEGKSKKELKAAEKAAKTAEKEAAKQAKIEEKEKAKEQKKLEKAAKKAAKKGVVEELGGGDAAGGAGWTDGVDEESTPEGGSARVSPVDSPVVVTAGGSLDALASAVWKGGEDGGHELAIFTAPVDAIRACAVQRKDKKCIVLIDRDNGDSFLAVARLVQKMKKDQCWRFYKSPQAIGCKKQDLTKDKRLGYFGKLEFQDPTVLFGLILASFLARSARLILVVLCVAEFNGG